MCASRKREIRNKDGFNLTAWENDLKKMAGFQIRGDLVYQLDIVEVINRLSFMDTVRSEDQTTVMYYYVTFLKYCISK